MTKRHSGMSFWTAGHAFALALALAATGVARAGSAGVTPEFCRAEAGAARVQAQSADSLRKTLGETGLASSSDPLQSIDRAYGIALMSATLLPFATEYERVAGQCAELARKTGNADLAKVAVELASSAGGLAVTLQATARSASVRAYRGEFGVSLKTGTPEEMYRVAGSDGVDHFNELLYDSRPGRPTFYAIRQSVDEQIEASFEPAASETRQTLDGASDQFEFVGPVQDEAAPRASAAAGGTAKVRAPAASSASSFSAQILAEAKANSPKTATDALARFKSAMRLFQPINNLAKVSDGLSRAFFHADRCIQLGLTALQKLEAMAVNPSCTETTIAEAKALQAEVKAAVEADSVLHQFIDEAELALIQLAGTPGADAVKAELEGRQLKAAALDSQVAGIDRRTLRPTVSIVTACTRKLSEAPAATGEGQVSDHVSPAGDSTVVPGGHQPSEGTGHSESGQSR